MKTIRSVCLFLLVACVAPATGQYTETKLTASDAAALDMFGFSVSVSGDTAIAGAPNNDDDGSDSGSAYIFQRDEGGTGNWGEVIKLTASDAAAEDQFGYAVSISGDTAIVGAYVNTDHGSYSG
ncbi:MAG: FG-GAP repeat protein, partial [Planctomycetota bacterium]